MYEIQTFKKIFFVILIFTLLILFILAIFNDKYNQNKIKQEIYLEKENIYIECYNKSKKKHKNLSECIKKENDNKNKIKDILEINIKNISLTKEMINSSLEGIVRGSIFGYIIKSYEGAFVGLILFAILNPILTYFKYILNLKCDLI